MLKVVDLKGKGLGKVYLETMCEKIALEFVRKERSQNGRCLFIYNADGSSYGWEG